MVDVALKDGLKTYFNGTLAGTPNSVYDEIINREVVRNAYSRRKSPTSFMLKKRRGFKQATGVVTGTITDIAELTDMGVTWLYVYSITDTNFYVYKKIKDSCDGLTQIDTGTRCENMFTGFAKTTFVKGPKREIYTAGSVFNTSADMILTVPSYPQAFGNVAGVTYDWGATNGPTQGDYIWVYKSTSDAIPSQVRKITDRVASGYNSRDTLIVSSPREMPGSGATASGAEHAIFPDWGDVLLYAGQDTGYMGASTLNCVKIIHSPYSINAAGTQTTTDTITTIWNTINESGATNRCVVSMTDHNGTFIIHYDNGYSVYGTNPSSTTSGYYKFYHTVEEQIDFGKDITEITSFRNFAVGFGESKVSISVLSYITGVINLQAQSYVLRDDLGIRNNGAWCIYDNSMYFVASDKRLYSVSIKNDGDGYVLDLADQSAPFIGHLENLKDGDEVYMEVRNNDIKIYINYEGNDVGDTYRCKILIYDKDYGFMHWWESTWRVIGSLDEYFMGGDALLFLCGNTDAAGDFFECKVSAYIGNNEPNGTETNLFEKKSLNRGKVILGSGIYNNGYTYINAYSWKDGWKTVQHVNGIENVIGISKYETRTTTGDVTYDGCLGFSDENTYTGVTGGRDRDRAVVDNRCGPSTNDCPTYIEDVAEGIAIASPIDQISEIRTVVIPLKTLPSDLIKIELVGRGGDIPVFGGMLREIQKYPFDDISTYGDAIWEDPTCSLSLY